MKRLFFLIVIFILISGSFAWAFNQWGMDWRDTGPKRKNWIKVSDGIGGPHYMDLRSIKRIKGARRIYQVRICNSGNSGQHGRIWVYYYERINCDTKQAQEQGPQSEWLAPESQDEMTPWEEGAMKRVCK